ncbi:hypothetical protein R6Q57_014539 [Mikania cordata]
MGRRLWCIRENGEEFDYEIIYDDEDESDPLYDHENAQEDENETEAEDDEIVRTQESDPLSDYIHMESEDESDPPYDHEIDTEDDDDYMDFVEDDIHDEGLEQKIELDQQKLQDEFDLDIYDFDSLTDEENDCPLKRSLRKLRRKKKLNRDIVNEPFYVESRSTMASNKMVKLHRQMQDGFILHHGLRAVKRRPGFLLVQEVVHDVLDPHEHITNWSAIEEDEDIEDEDMFLGRAWKSLLAYFTR